MKIPQAYRWLTKLQGLPKTIQLGFALHGVQEVVGRGSNKTIIGWRDELNQAGVKITGFNDDDIPWCGLFAAIVCFRRMGIPEEIPASPLWARNWGKYGVKTAQPALGDILVFTRGSGGHVGFYVAEDKTAYHVLGGNQSNRVSVTRIAKNRCIHCRLPPYKNQPAAVKSYHVAGSGKLSTNEA